MKKKHIIRWIVSFFLFCLLGIGYGQEIQVSAFSADDIGTYSSDASVVGIKINYEGELYSYIYDVWEKNDTGWEYVSSNINGAVGTYTNSKYVSPFLWLIDPEDSIHRFSVAAYNLFSDWALSDQCSILIEREAKGRKYPNILETSYDDFSSYNSIYSLLRAVKNSDSTVNISSYSGDGVSYTYNIYKILNINEDGDIRVKQGNWSVCEPGAAYYDGSHYIIQSLPEVTPDMDGYQCTFDGWYNSADGGEKYEVGDTIGKGEMIYPHWIKEPIRYNVQCIDVLGNGVSGDTLGKSSWSQEYNSVASGAQAGCIPLESLYYEGMIYTGCSEITVKTTGNIVYRYFNYAEYPVQMVDQIVSGPNVGKNLSTTSRQYLYKTVVSGAALGNDGSVGIYYPGYFYTHSTSDTVKTSGTIVYRYFAPVQYSILFDGNGATSGEMSAIESCWYDQTYTLTTNTYKKEINLVFDLQADDAVCDTQKKTISLLWKGWADSSTGGVRYSDGASVQNLMDSSGQKTLFAVWQPADVTVTAIPKRMGYTFAGWSPDPDAASGNMEFQLSADTKLYAIWKPEIVNYHVEYYKENLKGNFELATQYTFSNYTDSMIFIGDTVMDYPGFYLDEGSSKLQGTVSGDGSLILVAYYRRNTYQISFDGMYEDTDIETPQTVLCGVYEQEVQIPDITLEREGYEFLGWTADENSDQIYCRPGESYHIPNHDQTLYAVWQPKSYDIYFDANISSDDEDPVVGKMDAIQGYYDMEITLPPCGWSRNGYRFVGWNISSDGSGACYEEGQTICIPYHAEQPSITLYGMWEALEGEVQYCSNVPETCSATVKGMMDPTKYRYDEEWHLSQCFYELPGYDFLGWNTKADGSGEFYEEQESMYKKIPKAGIQTLYAMWAPRSDTRFLLLLEKPGLDAQEINSEVLVLEGETDTTLAEAILAYYEKQGCVTTVQDFVYGFTVKNPEILEQTHVAPNGETMVVLSLERKHYSVSVMRDISDSESECYASDAVLYEGEYCFPDELEGIGPVSRYIDQDGKTYLPGEEIVITQDRSFMAQHLITYHIENEDIEQYVSHNMPISLQQPEEKGYYFEGWYFDDVNREYAGNGGSVIYFVEDADLYAKWSKEKITYHIQYQLGEKGEIVIIDGNVDQYQYEDQIILPTATQVILPQGYEFVGWYEQGDIQKNIVTAISKEEYGDKVYCLLIQKTEENQEGSLQEEETEVEKKDASDDIPKDMEDKNDLPEPVEQTQDTSGQHVQAVQSKAMSSSAGSAVSNIFAVKGDSEKKTNMKFTKGKLTYQRNSSKKKTVKVIAVNTKAKQIKIPNRVTWKGNSYQVTEIAVKAFKGCNKLTKVTIGKQVTKIGRKAFYQCKKLKQVIFQGKGIRQIQKNAFAKTNSNITFMTSEKYWKKYIRLLKKSGFKKSNRHMVVV